MEPRSSFDLSDFQTRRRDVEKAFYLIKTATARIDLPAVVRELDRTAAGLRDNRFKIVVAGEFSQGKSTFINALLGERLLPSSPTPTTAILNRLRNGVPGSISLVQADGSRIAGLEIAEFKKVVAPPEPVKGDPESENAYPADWGTPSDCLCRCGLAFTYDWRRRRIGGHARDKRS